METPDVHLSRPVIKDIYRYLLGSRNEQYGETIHDVYKHLYSRNRNNAKMLNICDEMDLAAFLALYPSAFRCFLSDDGTRYVKPTTKLKLCTSHSSRSGSCNGDCRSLHLCKFYLMSSQCPFGGRCLFGHSLDSKCQLLEEHLLDGFSLTELRRLFCLPWVRRGVTVPRVCRYYNKHSGCTKQNCNSLHLCGPYLDHKCKFGKSCMRNHNIDDLQVKNVLILYGIKFSGRPFTSILDEIRSFPADDNNDEYGDTYDYSDGKETPPCRRTATQNKPISRSSSTTRAYPAFQLQLEPSQWERQRMERSKRENFNSAQEKTEPTRPHTATPFTRPQTARDSMSVIPGEPSMFAKCSSSQAPSLTSNKVFTDLSEASTGTLMLRNLVVEPTSTQYGTAASLDQTQVKEYRMKEWDRDSCASFRHAVSARSEQGPCRNLMTHHNEDLIVSPMCHQPPSSTTVLKTTASVQVQGVRNNIMGTETIRNQFVGSTPPSQVHTRSFATSLKSPATSLMSPAANSQRKQSEPEVGQFEIMGNFSKAKPNTVSSTLPATLSLFENISHISNTRPTGLSSFLPPSQNNSAMLALSTAPKLLPDSFVQNVPINKQLGATLQASCPVDPQQSERQTSRSLLRKHQDKLDHGCPEIPPYLSVINRSMEGSSPHPYSLAPFIKS